MTETAEKLAIWKEKAADLTLLSINCQPCRDWNCTDPNHDAIRAEREKHRQSLVALIADLERLEKERDDAVKLLHKQQRRPCALTADYPVAGHPCKENCVPCQTVDFLASLPEHPNG